MKKSILIMISLFAICMSNANAQGNVWGFRIGYSNYVETVKLSNMSAASASINVNAPGLEFGPVYYFLFKKNFYFNGGILLDVILPYDDGIIFRNGDKNYFVNMPLYLGINAPLGNNGFSIFAQAGYYFGYYFTSNSDVNEILNNFPDELQWGLGIMTGINIKRFKFEIGYKYGLSKLNNYNLITLDDGSRVEFSSKLSSVFLGVSYVF